MGKVWFLQVVFVTASSVAFGFAPLSSCKSLVSTSSPFQHTGIRSDPHWQAAASDDGEKLNEDQEGTVATAAVLERPSTTSSQASTNQQQEGASSSFSLSTSTSSSSSVVDQVSMMAPTTSTAVSAPSGSNDEYQRGLITIGFCTLVFASMSPAMHAALQSGSGAASCPVVLLNAAVSVVAFLGLAATGPFLETLIPPPSTLQQQQQEKEQLDATSTLKPKRREDPSGLWALFGSVDVATKAGLELGLWKFLGTVANLYGLSMTTADHGAFLIQLTTLIVPTVQGIMGVPIPQRIQWAVGLALAGVALFTQDAGGAASDAMASSSRLLGDALCVVAAGFYATYDLRLFSWGKQVAARQLITTKIAVQATLSVLLLAAVGIPETTAFVQGVLSGDSSSVDSSGLGLLGAIVLWSGFMVNAMVPFLQVGGQQAIGPTRAQTLYASQPLWAAMLSYAFLGETVGTAGLVGGGAFLSALFLAATAEAPDPNCPQEQCEI